MPRERRSILPGVLGLPAWGAVAVAVGFTLVGFGVDAVSGNELTSTFSAFYALGCLLAILVAAQRAVFTAMVQPPLILFGAVPLGQFVLADGSSLALRDLAINVAYPLVDRFPVMLATTAATVIIGILRLTVLSRDQGGEQRRQDRRRPSQRGTSKKSSARESSAKTTAINTQKPRPPRKDRDATDPIRRTREPAPTARTSGRPAPGRGTAPQRGPQPNPRRAADPQRAQQPGPDPRRAAPQPGRGPAPSPRRAPGPAPQREPARGRSQDPRRMPEQPQRAHEPQRGSEPRRRPQPRPPFDEVPAHPVPQVRYRERGDRSPFERND
ncbi:MAG: hypothetical protein GX542_01435 [Rhodococcus sp.]|nr:hypothetical protein [Rhodococcus sp. (in: high G+C Gram-positive bacteria)]